MITTNNEIFNGLCRSLLTENELRLMMVDKVGPITTDLSYMKQWDEIIKNKEEEIKKIKQWKTMCELAAELKVEFKEEN